MSRIVPRCFLRAEDLYACRGGRVDAPAVVYREAVPAESLIRSASAAGG